MAFEQLKLSSQICFRLYSASRLVTQTYKPFLDKLGITYPQYLVLMVLWETDNQPVNDIAHKLLLETNTVTPLIQRMEKMGLVIRTKGIVDTRQRIVSLTKEGKAMEKEAAKVPACMLEHFADCGLKKEEVFRLVPLLDEVINRLKDHTKDDFTTSKTKK
ncbi:MULTISPECIES: MarR family winged helix-turn-helix transcriptional regulator [Prevotellaceae]|jgi:transcriptional regulator, MarR family|uniref:HTH-type transcriptional regulator SarZ n=1 Tax=Segatella oris C735 TaxID=563008 RepID=D7NA35_9BACT|nr:MULTISPECIES: MarR family transcriptional regulator [Prevotellaceae]EFI49792.1 transcriptional regulator, MarR family [Segatella oris C735]OFO71857.1 MarR family transcriptional regulator [Prevotella sp. HMSC077E08]OFP28929.1 MarR family transcriptional regulator [Prevotella sp. HMSC069G02]OFP52901.1 MarR family transcriptional regulator [Prevotella sp. HMSC077E09]